MTKKELRKEQTNRFIESTIITTDSLLSKYLYDSAKMEEFLSFIANLNNKYSFINMCLIRSQFPGASIVKSYSSWKKENIQVRKSEKGISIFRPKVIKYVVYNNAKVTKDKWTNEIKELVKNNELEVYTYTKGFTLAKVFDISQTILPKEKYPKQYFSYFIKEDDENINPNAKLLSLLCNFIAKHNIGITYATMGLNTSEQRFYDTNIHGIKHWIRLNDKNSITQNIYSLVKEYAHTLLGHDISAISKIENKYQAQLVAYAICKSFRLKGIEISSFDEFRSWVNQSTKEMRKKWINSVIFASKQFANDFNYFLDEIEINVIKAHLSETASLNEAVGRK
ncbi:Hypothetical protein MAGb_0140 [Mycoplasmopsis agalactiae 14628]|uniref:N-terminal domain-containing protein n=1 Tax=Mycoplasmopsis agalactiae 14628 TaxID=1110504 RepID=I5D727_MYCAA|nr:ArdC-like ssDNA-binding domain-containing protein [Mycoplasmopsis agalactiae]EIN15486.1 Hypothetical protein MAGb_0140 [Mycoplasmopsis agalactiae 14628]